MNAETTYGLSPKRLAWLLGIGVGGLGQKSRKRCERAIADLLRAQLFGILSLDSASVDVLPLLIEHLCRCLPQLSGRSLWDALASPNTDCDTLVAIKNYCKTWASEGLSQVELAAGTAIYYGAIASALLFHDRKISAYAYAGLADAFDTLLGVPWMVSELEEHLARAARLCRRKA